MAETEQTPLHVDAVIEQDKEITKCESTKCRFFKSNGWKTTFIIVLVKENVFFSGIIVVLKHHNDILQVSLILRSLIHAKSSKYKVKTDGFLELVPEKYDDSDLVEWQPMPAPISRPEEPGNLGILAINWFLK